MRTIWGFVSAIALSFVLAAALPAQAQPGFGHNHHGGHDGSWPDSLETITVTGTVIVDASYEHPLYFLEVDGDGEADYQLAFGPWWYEPESGATRPGDGQIVTITGAEMDEMTPAVLMVFDIDGQVWREPVMLGRHGWQGGPMWGDAEGDTITVTGVVLLDTTYYYTHFFLDTDADSIPEYKLSFGPPWYVPSSGAALPQAGETVTIFGRRHETGMGFDMLTVLEINGEQWRPTTGPAPWAGTWMHRDHGDTLRVHCLTDSMSWVAFPPGHMGGHMGGTMWPDSLFVQFWEVYPDSMPGHHGSGYARGFYLEILDPQGHTMMGRGQGWGHGRMSFDQPQQFRFHYDDQFDHMGQSEDDMGVYQWNADSEAWEEMGGVTVNTEANSVSFSTSDLSNYYLLSTPENVTGIAPAVTNSVPTESGLRQSYPNPFSTSLASATTMRLDLASPGHVRLAVYNLLGQRVALLVDETRSTGSYAVRWDGRNDRGSLVPSGVYIVRLEAGGLTSVHRLTLLK